MTTPETTMQVQQPRPAQRERFVSAERASVDRIQDPLWREANQIAYRIGLSGGFPNFVYRALKLEQRVAEYQFAISQLSARLEKLELNLESKS